MDIKYPSAPEDRYGCGLVPMSLSNTRLLCQLLSQLPSQHLFLPFAPSQNPKGFDEAYALQTALLPICQILLLHLPMSSLASFPTVPFPICPILVLDLPMRSNLLPNIFLISLKLVIELHMISEVNLQTVRLLGSFLLFQLRSMSR